MAADDDVGVGEEGGVRIGIVASIETAGPAEIVATNGTLVAYALPDELCVRVRSVRSTSSAELALPVVNEVGFGCKAQGLHMSGGSDLLVTKWLYAATRHHALRWDVDACFASRERGEAIRAERLDVPEGCFTSAMATDARSRWLAVVANDEVLVYATSQGGGGRLVLRLRGHLLQINALAFDVHVSDRLVTASDDRTFRVWDLSRGELAYESGILGAAPLISVAIDPTFPRMAIGSTDGAIRFFDAAAPGHPLLQRIDIVALAARQRLPPPPDAEAPASRGGVRVVGPSARMAAAGAREAPWSDPAGGVGSASSLSHLFYTRCVKAPRPDVGLFPQAPILIACTTSGIFALDAYTYDVVVAASCAAHVNYKRGCRLALDTPRLFAAEAKAEGGRLALAIASAFTPRIDVVSVEQREGAHEATGEAASVREDGRPDAEAVSVFPAGMLTRLSSLYLGGEREASSAASNHITSFETFANQSKAKRGRMKMRGDKPITFHAKVKSSGYGKVQPLRFLGKPVASRAPATKKANGGLKSGRLMRSYPMDCEPVHNFQGHHALDGEEGVHTGPILRACFCPDGSRILTASVDKAARSVRVPLVKYRGDGETFLGHAAAVLDVCWSHDGRMALTASSDRTACLWGAKRSMALVKFRGIHGRRGLKCEFKSDVRAAKFFHLDKLVVLACMNKLHVFKYDLGQGTAVTDDIAKAHQQATCTHILELPAQAQSISDFGCHNGFISHVLVAGTSAKSIEIFDANAGATLRTIRDAHTRAIHRIVVNATSHYANHDKDAHELFLSAATDGCVKLWDVRSPRSVRCFAGHLNRQNPVGCNFSPCMKYIACGSEDKVSPATNDNASAATPDP